MPSNNEEDGDEPTGTISERQLTEIMGEFFAQLGASSQRLQESSEDRLDRVNKMAEALCDAVKRTSQTASAHGDICRLTLAAAEERIASLRADRDRCRMLLEDSQREVIRLTDLTEAMQRLFEEVVRELARQGGNTTTIGNLSGKTI